MNRSNQSWESLVAGKVMQMMASDPQLAAALVALLARKLSMRLRVVGARLSERQTQEPQ